MENVLLLMAFAGIVLVGGCVVIQSIFRISIIDKIKSYGQLRTVGATKKQIMRIVKKRDTLWDGKACLSEFYLV